MKIFTLQASAVFCFLTVSAFAQQTDTPPADTEAPAQTEYGGPAILSRGATSSLRAPTRNISFRPFITLTGAYDTRITPAIVGRSVKLVDEGSLGPDPEPGVYGVHR